MIRRSLLVAALTISAAFAQAQTVAQQRAKNIHVRDGVGEREFVEMRQARDAMLEVPTLILPSIQVNIRAGRLPPPEDDGVSYLKIPLNVLGKAADQCPEPDRDAP
jgi:hypothetical protein